ncbi:hypothetical protein HZA98_02745 [Candidatus Woesearchaeota archaeon]|nr:hypothetical protein [Candidatus Woesearchaeota archaeon]
MKGVSQFIKVEPKVSIIAEGYKIKAKGTYNLEDLYVELNQWFTHMNYKWKELEYKVIAGKGGFQRLELLWEGRKEADKYSTFVITLALGAEINEVEVALDTGAKVKRQKGTLEFRSSAYILKDISVWKDKFMGDQIARVYEILIRDRLKQQEEDLYHEAHKLYDELKAFMMLYR